MLVGVTIVIAVSSWAISTAFRTSDGPPPTTLPPQTIAAADRGPARIVAKPTTLLFDGGDVAITSRAFPAGTEVEAGLCLTSAPIHKGMGRICHERGINTATVDPSGRLEVGLTSYRQFEVDGTTYDCTIGEGVCAVSVVSKTDPELWDAVAVSFDASDPRRALELPD